MKKSTVARTFILIVALVNQVGATFGWTPAQVSNEDIYLLVSSAFTVSASLRCWWKNNSFTQGAITADKLKDAAKKAAKGFYEDILEDILENQIYKDGEYDE